MGEIVHERVQGFKIISYSVPHIEIIRLSKSGAHSAIAGIFAVSMTAKQCLKYIFLFKTGAPKNLVLGGSIDGYCYRQAFYNAAGAEYR